MTTEQKQAKPVQECKKCEDYGFYCKRGNFLHRLTGREKIVVIPSSFASFAHDFKIEICEVVTGEVSVDKYAKTLAKYLRTVKGISITSKKR